MCDCCKFIPTFFDSLISTIKALIDFYVLGFEGKRKYIVNSVQSLIFYFRSKFDSFICNKYVLFFDF